jgi:hypothetical protein
MTTRTKALKTKTAAERTTAIRKKVKGFTDEERAAMRERVQELKTGKADGESAVLAKIAEMPEPDRIVGERLHAIIKASAPVLAETLVRDLSVYSTTSVSTSIISNADNCSQSCGLSLSNG